MHQTAQTQLPDVIVMGPFDTEEPLEPLELGTLVTFDKKQAASRSLGYWRLVISRVCVAFAILCGFALSVVDCLRMLRIWL